MTTLKDVAKDAGVSTATVSCCLSGKKNVKPETKMRVMDSIEKLKYIPNRSARDLKNFSSNLVGVVITDMDNACHSEIFKGISAVLQRHGYNVSVAFSDNSPVTEQERIEDFISQNAAGLLLITCQPHNENFFRNRILNYNVPTVFIEQKPLLSNVNFCGFDNYATAYFLTDALLKRGYERIALICGYDSFSAEEASCRGYSDALKDTDTGNIFSPLIFQTDFSKEDAFKVTLTQLCRQMPDAILSTSQNIALGAVEALETYGIRVPDNVTVVTYGEESWNNSSRRDGLIHTMRTAFSLGEEAGTLLLNNIRNKKCEEIACRILQDPVIENIPSIPLRNTLAPAAVFSGEHQTKLRILMVDLPTAHSIRLLSRHFMKTTGISLELDYVPQEEMLKKISDSIEGLRESYDLYMYDIPWLNYMVQNTFLADITDFVTSQAFHSDRLFKVNLDSCMHEGIYYGIPLVGGTQILFYRRDLFENRELIKAYLSRYHLSLRPPRTWDEFNHTAEFFTKAYNPLSPTEFGTSFAGITDEELAPEIFIRLWAYGGRLWDEYRRPCLNTPENARAFRNILETLTFTRGDPHTISISDTVEDFINGRSAMLITYSEYASQISRSIRRNIIGQVGYEILPGKRPVNVGWNVGLNPFSPNRDPAFSFFRWILRKDTSFYMTILDGQSPAKAPYRSQELLRLYPWMSITEKSFSYVQKRTGPNKAHALVIPQNKIEAILCGVLHMILKDGLSIEEALSINQKKMIALFRLYGYPCPFCD